MTADREFNPSNEQEQPETGPEKDSNLPERPLTVGAQSAASVNVPYELPPMRPYGPLPERWRRRQRLCIYLFFATCLSTFLVGSELFPAMLVADGRKYIQQTGVWKMAIEGLKYSCPVMLILLCHEMGHYLQARRYGVPATLPFFIPMPIPPLGTMGAVIVQGAGVANRKAMFDIAVSGPLAGLVIALPVLYYGVTQSVLQDVATLDTSKGWLEFGDPLILQYMIDIVHGPIPEGKILYASKWYLAGWVGVLITALNLVPVGQLDGGHILYTLIGKKAHYVAYGTLCCAFGYMAYIGEPTYLLLFILMIFMGPKHPPTSNDAMKLGWVRHVVGWATLSFIIVGFTLKPIDFHEAEPSATPATKPVDDVEIKVVPGNASTRLLRHIKVG